MKILYSLIILMILAPNALQAQDTLILNNGDEKLVHVKELNQRMLYVSFQKKISKKAKVRGLDLREVYSVHFKDSAQVITYFQDTNSELYFDTESMGRFVAGERYAKEHYKAPLVTIGGVVTGFAGPTVNFFYGILVPAAYTITLGNIPVSTRKLARNEPSLYADPYFVEGYKTKARKKKTMNAIWGSLIGIGAAVITTSVVLITNPAE